MKLNADNEKAPKGSASEMDGVSMLPETINGFTPQTLDWYEGILGLFPGEHRRKSKTDADVLCPVHEDHNPSLGVDLRQNGAGSKVVLNCSSRGCEYANILGAIGLTHAHLKFNAGVSATAHGCTLDGYAASKWACPVFTDCLPLSHSVSSQSNPFLL